MNDFKKCPFCAEEIKATAKKCKHCREWLDKNEHVETKIPQPSGLRSEKMFCRDCGKKMSGEAISCPECGHPTTAEVQKVKYDSEVLGTIALFIPILSAIIGYLWLNKLTRGDLMFRGSSVSSTYYLLTLGTVIITAVLIGIEASKLDMGGKTDLTKKGKKNSGPIAWVFVTALLWIIGFPAYMYTRSKYGLKNRLAFSILIALVFIGIVWYIANTINMNVSDTKRMFNL